MTSIYTLGYEGLTIEGFLARLRASQIETLVDVRQLALSRKAGFSKTPLAKALHGAGVEYVYERALGCPRPIRLAYRQNGDWSTYVRSYLGYLSAQSDSLAHVLRLAESRRICLLCFEADPSQCHRSLVAKALRGMTGGVAAISDLRQITAAD